MVLFSPLGLPVAAACVPVFPFVGSFGYSSDFCFWILAFVACFSSPASQRKAKEEFIWGTWLFSCAHDNKRFDLTSVLWIAPLRQ